MSEVYNAELHRRLKDDAQVRYDACYRIVDPIGFFNAICNDLAHRASLVGIHPVVYRDGVVPLDSAMAHAPPEWVKDRDVYADLREVRAVWRESDGKSVEPIIRQVPCVRQLCELIATI